MEVSKFIVGILTIAIALFFMGKLSSGIVFMTQRAAQGFSDHNGFKLRNFNEKLQK